MITTKEDFKYFNEVVQKYISLLGLTHYRVGVFLQKQIDGNRGSFWVDPEGKICTIYLSKDWGVDEITKENIRVCAIHEVLHLLLSDLVTEAACRYTSRDIICEREHEIIRRLENLI